MRALSSGQAQASLKAPKIPPSAERDAGAHARDRAALALAVLVRLLARQAARDVLTAPSCAREDRT